MTKPTTPALPELLKFSAAVEALKISRNKADRLISDPKSDFPRPFKIGSERFFRADDVRRWIARKADQANGQIGRSNPPAEAA